MKWIIRIIFCVLLFGVAQLNAQVTFTSAPERLKLYARSSDDSASVVLSGQVASSQWTKLIFTFHKDNVLSDSTIVNLDYSVNSTSPFNKTYRIKAKKSLYNFRVYVYNTFNTVRVLTADSVVCGDVFVVNGQSNGTANATSGGVDAPYLWIRSYGNPSVTASVALADTTWGLAQGNTGSQPYSIGVWGIRLAKMLVDTLNIPVCFINGARPGSEISQHLPAANPLDMNTFYGRLLYRVQKAGVAQNVKGIFWYQGENDGALSDAPLYATRFSQLRTAWQGHYPNVQKIFVMQTHPGCIDGLPEHWQVREALRKLSHTYPEVVTMSSVGIPGYDGCHFSVQGYQKIGSNWYRQVVRELYGINQPLTADPPDIISASFTNASNTELSLVFSQNVDWPAIQNGNNLKDYFYLNDPVNIISGSTMGNTVKLTLDGGCNATTVTYLPNQYYNGTSDTYDGPWLLNDDDIGAFSFYNFPIENQLIITADHSSFCGTNVVKFSCNKTGLNFQWYFNGNPINGGSNDKYNANQPGQYYLKSTDANNITLTSNTIVLSAGSSLIPLITSQGGKFYYCSGSNVILNATGGATSYLWNTGQTTSSITVSTTGNYTVTVSDGSGCTATSVAATVTERTPVIPTIISLKNVICSGDSILLSSSIPNVLNWSTGAASNSIYIYSAGTYQVTVSDSSGCQAVSNPYIINSGSVIKPSISVANTNFCKGDSVLLSVSSNYNALWSNGSTSKNIYVTNGGQYLVTVTDSVGCSAVSDPINLVEHIPAIPQITSSGTSVCNGDSVLLTASYGNSFSWSNGKTTPFIYTKISGIFTVMVTDSFGCKAVSPPVNITNGSLNTPVISASAINFCNGDSVMLSVSSNGSSILWSTGSVQPYIYTKVTGIYTVTVSDNHGCSAVSAPVATSKHTAVVPLIQKTGTSFCDGDSLLLTATNGIAYLWSNGKTTPFIYTLSAGTFTVQVTDSFGCKATSAATAIAKLTNVKSTITSPITQACLGTTVKLTSSSGSFYLWSTGQTTSSISVTLSNSYQVTVTKSNGCKSSANPVQITFNPGPAVSITPTGSMTVCTGGRQVITAYSPGAASLQWYKGTGKITGATTDTYTAVSSGTYTMRATNASGCTTASSAFVFAISSSPAATIATTDQFDFCQDTLATLTANSGTLFTYQWQKNTVNIAGATSQVYHTEAKASYRVIVFNQYGCSKTSSAVAIPLASVTATVTASGSRTFCNGDSVTFTANSGSGYTYQWQRNSINIAGATSISYVAKTAGNYRVRVTNAMGCVATSANSLVTITICTIRNSAMAESLNNGDLLNLYIYPNPSSGNFTIENTSTENAAYEIIDMSGRLLQAGQMDFKEGVFQLENQLQPGLYILRIEAEGIRKTYRLEKTAD